jgi:sn-1 stearoyl-lipid 9-desaturase
MRILRNDKTFKEPIIWASTIVLTLLHVGAIAALFMFSWKALILTIFLVWLGTGVGVGMCYHRLLTHRGYHTTKWMEYLLTICGTLALEGGPIAWVATHRVHHQNADKEGDPHSPRDGGIWAHIGWVCTGKAMHSATTEVLRYVPDLREDKFHRWISKYHWVPMVGLAALLYAVGGLPYVLWGICMKCVLGLHGTWLVNSATHMWGSRRFATKDDSKNSFWVAILTFGEGWHNNHHSNPTSARHGLAWYEVDFNYYGIAMLQLLGIAWDVKTHTPSA